jgi:pyrrolidone-carboxylate peptidase
MGVSGVGKGPRRVAKAKTAASAKTAKKAPAKPASWAAGAKPAPKSEFGGATGAAAKKGVALPKAIEVPDVGPVTLRPGERRLKVVVTGYGDFGGTWNEAEGRPNPSGELAKQLAKMGLSNADVEYRRLDVTHESVDAFMKEMETVKPDVVISMGVSGGYAQVEEAPENWSSGSTDGAGNAIVEGPNDPAIDAHKRLHTDLPVDAIDKALNGSAGALPDGRTIGTHVTRPRGNAYSPDDSAYLCNYLNFKLTQAYGKDDRVTAGFVHINPPMDGKPGTTAAEVKVIVQAVVNQQILTDRELDAKS